MSAKFFNYADIVGKAENARGARLENQINAYKLDEVENLLEKRKKVDAIMQQIQDTPARIEALEQAGLHDAAQELATSHVEIQKGRLTNMESEAKAINSDTWKDYRYAKIQAGARPELFPEEYDPNWMTSNKKTVADDIESITRKYGVPTSEQFPEGVAAQDITRKTLSGKTTVEEGEPYRPAGATRAPKGSGVKAYSSADAGRLQSSVRAHFGSIFNQASGEFNKLDDETEGKIASIQSRAEVIYREQKGAVGHLQASEIALAEFGEKVAGKPDPLRYRKGRE